jgi:hypothetical protein
MMMMIKDHIGFELQQAERPKPCSSCSKVCEPNQLSQGKVELRAFVNTVMKVNLSFSRR